MKTITVTIPKANTLADLYRGFRGELKKAVKGMEDVEVNSVSLKGNELSIEVKVD